MKGIPALLLLMGIIIPATALGASSGKDLGAVTGGEFTARQVIDTKCLTCHNRERIDYAIKQKKDMEKITTSMEKKGLRLTDKEREVLGIFWKQSPLK